MTTQYYYDIIILWWWSAGLFTSAFLSKEKKVCIIDKADKLWTKLLLSGGERCNVTNTDLNPTRDYVGENIKALPGIFHTFNNHDMIEFLASHGIETIVEASGRVLLKSGKAKELRDLLVQLATENGVEFFLGQNVIKVLRHPEWNEGYNWAKLDSWSAKADSEWQMIWGWQEYRFEITTNTETFYAKNLIVATGGKSYPQVGATAIGYELAEQFGVCFVAPRAALCGMEIIENVAELAGSPAQGKLRLLDGKKIIYETSWPLLFTHWWLSGPVVFDASLRAAQFLRDNERFLTIQLDLDLEHTSKKVIRCFPSLEKENKLSFSLKWLRPRKESKVSVWWVNLQALDKYFQVKTIPWLYFIGEILDVTWRSWWYNLQRAWSSSYICAHSFS